MHRKIAMTMLALSLGGAVALNVASVSAQTGQEEQKQVQGKSRGGGGGRNAISRPSGGTRTARPDSVQRAITQRRPETTNQGKVFAAQPRTNTPRKAFTAQPRTDTPRKTFTARRPRTDTPREAYTAPPRNVAPKGASKIISPEGGKRAAVAGKLRGAGHATIRGRNFSVWRGKHRVRHNNSWRTFVALSALGSIVFGSDDYYAYAYLSATQPYCEGVTYDGCILRWREVETIEGDVIEQCVAYCPRR